MITPGTQALTGYIGSTFDTIITVYPSADSAYNWVGSWVQGVNYSIGTVVIATDNNAYDALKANVSVNPIGDLTGTWSTPITPMNLNGWSGYIMVEPISPDTDQFDVSPLIATPVQIQGASGTISIKFTPAQSATPQIEPGNYHHYIAMTDPAGDIYYFLKGTFTWNSP